MNVWEMFMSSFRGLLDGIESFSGFVHTVASFNYYILSSVFHFISLLLNTACCVIGETWYLFSDVLKNLGDFLLELVLFTRSALVLLWKFILVIWHLLTFILSSLEVLVVTLWSGVVFSLRVVSQSILDVGRTCGATYLYGKGMLGGIFNNTVEGFALLGSGVQNLCLSTWNGVVETIKLLSHSSVDLFIEKFRQLQREIRYIFVDVFYNIPKEAYLGVVVCLFFYLIMSNMPRIVRFMHSRGLTVPFVIGGRRERNYIDDTDDDMESEGSISDVSDEREEDDRSVGSAGVDSDDETETNVNNSDTNSDSDQEIDIQLPPANTFTRVMSRCGLRQQSQTPTLTDEQRASLSREELELQVEREKDKRACVVCQDRPKSVLILPCRHLCLCVECANQIAHARFIFNRVCPLCRASIKTIMNIYV